MTAKILIADDERAITELSTLGVLEQGALDRDLHATELIAH